MTNGGIYVHVPFCAGKCPYCDFYSVSPKNGTKEYTQAVLRELQTLERCADFITKDFRDGMFSSLYIGGGTPSVLPADELCAIILTARREFRFSEDAEITVECNPSSDDLADKLTAMKKAGANRLSFGMQSAVDAERKKLGRRADREGVKNAFLLAREAGFDNISLDVMLGIPGQTADSLRETLSFAVSLGADHISAYMLKLEEGTFFAKNAAKLDLPDDDATADFYLATCRFLENNGYRHYEISNFCRNGKTGKHNLKYWLEGDYLGIGPAAHSLIAGSRFYYGRDLMSFIRGAKPVYDSPGGTPDEKIILPLRTDTGIDIPAGTENFCEKLLREKLAVTREGRLCLTAKGMLISNAIISELLSETGL